MEAGGGQLLFYVQVLKIYTDRNKIRKVLSSLVDNSIKHTLKGFIRMKPSDQGQYVRFEVTDSGVGILKDDLASIFKKFTPHQFRTRFFVNILRYARNRLRLSQENIHDEF
jgi:K+-sensing histidine kinase KdpD